MAFTERLASCFAWELERSWKNRCLERREKKEKGVRDMKQVNTRTHVHTQMQKAQARMPFKCLIELNNTEINMLC